MHVCQIVYIAQCIAGISSKILMKNKRFGWMVSVRSSQDLRLKTLFGLVLSLFIFRDIRFVKHSQKQKDNSKKRY